MDQHQPRQLPDIVEPEAVELHAYNDPSGRPVVCFNVNGITVARVLRPKRTVVTETTEGIVEW